jgi:hypothetical protein
MPQFYITARIYVDCGKEISAATMEEALEKSKTMTVEDFITVDFEHNDNRFQIHGVQRAYREPKL